MKKLVFALLLLIPCCVKAQYCNYVDLAGFKKEAGNITYSYDYSIQGDNALFDIKLNNLNQNLFFKINDKIYTYTRNELVLKGFNSGEKIVIYVYTNNEECKDEILRVININLPKYNPYYQLDICNGLENYSLCQKWSNHNYSKTDFIIKVNEYKESLKKDEDKKPDDVIDSKTELIDDIITFFISYYYYILGGIILICVVAMIVSNKKDSFDL